MSTQKKNNARLPDIQTMLAAGFNPKTGLPIKLDNADGSALKDSIKKQIRIRDEQDAINRYTWYNLPSGLDGQLLERILYYKGQAMFFYMSTNNTFYFLPYALDGSIDVYGRYTGVTPLPFGGGTTKSESGKEKPWITGLVRKPVYDVITEGWGLDAIEDSCVLLSDYSKQLSQTVIPRQVLQEGLIDIMSDLIPFERTALLNSTGVMGMRVGSPDEESNVEAASRSVNQAALEGRKYIAINGQIDFQELTGSNVGTAESFLMAFQSLDNLRKDFYGLPSGGVFQKAVYQTVGQTEMNTSTGFSPYQDGLTLRQKFCDIVNSIWGLGIWCDISEQALGIDQDLNMVTADEQDQSGVPGEQPEEAVNE